MTLENGDPFLIYSKAHTASKASRTSVPTAKIVGEWLDIAEKMIIVLFW